MKRIVVSLALLLSACFLASTSIAAVIEPSDLINQTSTQVRDLLMKEDGSNTETIRVEVQALIFPKFDFRRMTALSVGKNWRAATPEQQQQLITQFQTLLTRTYFSTMLRYRDAKLNVVPGALIENEGKEATVKTNVTIANAEGDKPIAIDYVLYSTDEGWKVFNVNVEGASLVTVYRNQFNDEITKNGVDGLIKVLQDKNAANQSVAEPAPANGNK